MLHDELQGRAAGLHVAEETHKPPSSSSLCSVELMETFHSPLIFTVQQFVDLRKNRRTDVQFPQSPET